MKKATLLCLVIACGSAADPPARNPQQRIGDSAAAVAALQRSKFEDARREATAALARDPRNSRAAAVRAIVAYQAAGHRLITDLGKVLEESSALKLLDHASGRAAWSDFLRELDAIDKDLAIVAADRDFSLEICLACWEHDWNRSGEIDERDRKLFEIEFDGRGGELAEGDPRRRPTFRLDVGDADWARAMIAFQRAAVEIVLAYRWTELDKLFLMFGSSSPAEKIVIHLETPDRVKRARELVIAGLGYADRCRAAYLAETDDDREWVPNPRQKSYAMPLPVDAALYENWAAITGDLRRMLKSEEGISFREVDGLVDEEAPTRLPDAYLDLGAMLREPKNIELDLALLENRPGPAAVEKIMRGLPGNGFKTKMRPTPLVGRLRQMKNELSRGEDTFERKLRYLMWLN